MNHAEREGEREGGLNMDTLHSFAKNNGHGSVLIYGVCYTRRANAPQENIYTPTYIEG